MEHLFYFFVTSIYSAIVTSIISKRKIVYRPEFDLYFNYFKPIKGLTCLPDFYILVSFFYNFVNITSLDNFMLDWSIIFFIRATSMLLTSGFYCMRHIDMARCHGIFNSGNNDLIISGHAATSMLLYLHGKRDMISFLLCLQGVLINLINGDHYSSDIFLSVVLSLLVKR